MQVVERTGAIYARGRARKQAVRDTPYSARQSAPYRAGSAGCLGSGYGVSAACHSPYAVAQREPTCCERSAQTPMYGAQVRRAALASIKEKRREVYQTARR